MSQLSTQVNNDYISLDEASQQFGISYSSFCRLLRSNPDIRDKYTEKMTYYGRRRTVIHIEALPILVVVKDKDRGNQNKKMTLSDTFREGKKKLAEKAIEQAKENPVDVINTLIKNLELLREQSTRLNNHEDRLNELEGDMGKMKMSDGQRERLNERIRLLAIQLTIPFGKMWSELHNITGRRNIDLYTFQDYGIAITWLRQVFKKNNINW